MSDAETNLLLYTILRRLADLELKIDELSADNEIDRAENAKAVGDLLAPPQPPRPPRGKRPSLVIDNTEDPSHAD